MNEDAAAVVCPLPDIMLKRVEHETASQIAELTCNALRAVHDGRITCGYVIVAGEKGFKNAHFFGQLMTAQVCCLAIQLDARAVSRRLGDSHDVACARCRVMSLHCKVCNEQHFLCHMSCDVTTLRNTGQRQSAGRRFTR